MTVIADSNLVYALYSAKDSLHRDAMSFVSQNIDSLLVPDVVLPEVCYLLMRDFGHSGMQTFLENFTQLDVQLEPIGMGRLGTSTGNRYHLCRCTIRHRGLLHHGYRGNA